MHKQIIYIAGKISGLEKEDVIAKFSKAQKEIEAKGHKAINPLEVVNNWNLSWQTCMKIALKQLCNADAIYLLPDWRESEGALIEYKLATTLGYDIYFDINDIPNDTDDSPLYNYIDFSCTKEGEVRISAHVTQHKMAEFLEDLSSLSFEFRKVILNTALKLTETNQPNT